MRSAGNTAAKDLAGLLLYVFPAMSPLHCGAAGMMAGWRIRNNPSIAGQPSGFGRVLIRVR